MVISETQSTIVNEAFLSGRRNKLALATYVNATSETSAKAQSSNNKDKQDSAYTVSISETAHQEAKAALARRQESEAANFNRSQQIEAAAFERKQQMEKAEFQRKQQLEASRFRYSGETV